MNTNVADLYQKPHLLEGTTILSSGYVMHYTCNPPNQSSLDKKGINAIGDQFSCRDPREMLMIPITLYESMGFQVRSGDITAVSESLLRKLGK